MIIAYLIWGLIALAVMAIVAAGAAVTLEPIIEFIRKSESDELANIIVGIAVCLLLAYFVGYWMYDFHWWSQ